MRIMAWFLSRIAHRQRAQREAPAPEADSVTFEYLLDIGVLPSLELEQVAHELAARMLAERTGKTWETPCAHKVLRGDGRWSYRVWCVPERMAVDA